MDDLLLQIILARRNDDTEGWMNILIVIVLAVFWVIGGIVKAKSRKPKTQDEQQPAHNLARRSPVHSRGPREQLLKQPHRPGTQQPRTKFADLRAAVHKFAAEAEQAFQANAREPNPELELPLTEPQIKAERVDLTEPISKTAKGLQDKRASEPEQMPESEYLSELLTDYADPEELRRAILHYEILGKPLSLRDQV